MVDPIENIPARSPESDHNAELSGRPALSLDSFRAVAVEVAEKLGEPVAICLRPESIGGAKTLPFANKPLRLAKEDGSEIIEIVYPPALNSAEKLSDSPEFRARVIEALNQTPGGQKLDTYFGISSGTPVQPPEEATKGEELLKELKSAASSGAGLSDLLKRISAHTETSGADPDVLRALMRRGRKPAP